MSHVIPFESHWCWCWFRLLLLLVSGRSVCTCECVCVCVSCALFGWLRYFSFIFIYSFAASLGFVFGVSSCMHSMDVVTRLCSMIPCVGIDCIASHHITWDPTQTKTTFSHSLTFADKITTIIIIEWLVTTDDKPNGSTDTGERIDGVRERHAQTRENENEPMTASNVYVSTLATLSQSHIIKYRNRKSLEQTKRIHPGRPFDYGCVAGRCVQCALTHRLRCGC